MKFIIWFSLCLLLLGVGWYVRKWFAAAHRFITKRLPRMFEWLLAAIATCLLAFILAPQQLPVSVYKISLIAIAGVMGYWLDRSLFPYARPDSFLSNEVTSSEPDDTPLCFENQPDWLFLNPQNDVLFGVSMIRRAVIVAAAMIAVGLGA